MAPVEESNQVQVEETQGAQPEHASATGEEILREAKQKQVERSAKNCKHKFNRDIKACKSMLNKYQAIFNEDDPNCGIQIMEAKNIIEVFNRIDERWKTLEIILEDIKDCICLNLTLSDVDMDDHHERVEEILIEYAGKRRKLTRENRETIERCFEILKQAANNTNNQISNKKSLKTQPNSGEKYLCKNQTEINSSEKSIFKDIRKIIKTDKIEQLISKSIRDKSIEEILDEAIIDEESESDESDDEYDEESDDEHDEESDDEYDEESDDENDEESDDEYDEYYHDDYDMEDGYGIDLDRDQLHLNNIQEKNQSKSQYKKGLKCKFYNKVSKCKTTRAYQN